MKLGSVRLILCPARRRLLPETQPRMSNAPTNPFAGVNTRADVANLICSTVKQLNYLLYGRKEHLRYTRFTVRKRRQPRHPRAARRPEVVPDGARRAAGPGLPPLRGGDG